MLEEARRLFLTIDQERAVRKFHLKSDEQYLFVRFFGENYRVHRRLGVITKADKAEAVEHQAAMTIYDLLNYSRDQELLPPMTGKWETLAQSVGLIGAGHEKRLHNPALIRRFTGRTEELNKICEDLGGRPVKGADVSCRIPAFDFLTVWFEFWDGDEEFPASVQFLWDAAAGSYLQHETLFYTVLYLEELLADRLQDKNAGEMG